MTTRSIQAKGNPAGSAPRKRMTVLRPDAVRVGRDDGTLGKEEGVRVVLMARHVFIDNSNIYGGAQRAAPTLEPGVVWPAVRVYFRNLVQLIERGGGVATRVLAGSVPPGSEDLWEHARRLGYNTDILRRVASDDGRLVEQAVDEVLLLKIANADAPA